MTYKNLLKYRLMDEEPGAGGGEGGEPGAGGGAPAETAWRESIPAEYKDSPMFSEDQVKDLPSLMNQFANSQKLLGDSIRIPGENADEESVNRFNEKLMGVKGVTRIPGMDAPEEEVNAFWAKMGVPETAEGYETYKPAEEDIPEGVELDNRLVEGFSQLAHQLKLTPAQMKGISEWHTKDSIEQAGAKIEKQKNMISELKKEYGSDFEARMSLATSVIEKFGSEYAVDDLSGSLGEHPGLAMMLADIGLATTEDGLMRRDSEGGEITKSNTEIQMEIDELMELDAYANKDHENHNAIVKKVAKLFEQQEVIKKQAKG